MTCIVFYDCLNFTWKKVIPKYQPFCVNIFWSETYNYVMPKQVQWCTCFQNWNVAPNIINHCLTSSTIKTQFVSHSNMLNSAKFIQNKFINKLEIFFLHCRQFIKKVKFNDWRLWLYTGICKNKVLMPAYLVWLCAVYLTL